MNKLIVFFALSIICASRLLAAQSLSDTNITHISTTTSTTTSSIGSVLVKDYESFQKYPV